MMRGSANNSSSVRSVLGKRANVSRDYFDDDDDDDNDAGFHRVNPPPSAPPSAPDEDEVDPLDSFMADVGNTVRTQQANPEPREPLPEIMSGQERDYEAYFDLQAKESKDAAAAASTLEYDSDGVPVGVRAAGERKEKIDPLPPVDHASIVYKPFHKNMYRAHPETLALTDSDVASIRGVCDINVMGNNVPKPVQTFQQAGFNTQLLHEISRLGYTAPTAIQMQALPVALSGRDLIGLAKTGSGKTLSFVWPMIVHVLDQPQMQLGDGPIGLVLAPTRELVTQIYTESKKFCKIFNIGVCAVYGGEGKWEMVRALKEAPEMVIATPGRMIDLISAKATNLRRCTMVVLDEADRMFELGFEYQMRSIVNNIRPDRQTLLFSATMKKKIEGFAREILQDPVRIVVGTIGASNKDIQQVVTIVERPEQKWQWLVGQVDDWVAEGKVLVFVGSKVDTEELTNNLKTFFQQRQLAVGVDSLHGDRTQTDRSSILRKFRSGEITILVATDVASRGLDVKDVRNVVNFDAAKNIETHVHRIGRTGRIGVDGVTPGTAHTILVASGTPTSSADSSLAVDLVRNLRDAGQEDQVSQHLLRLAQSDPRWHAVNYKNGSSKRFDSSSGGRLGVGCVGAAVAMTSAMLASTGQRQNPSCDNSKPQMHATQEFGANK